MTKNKWTRIPVPAYLDPWERIAEVLVLHFLITLNGRLLGLITQHGDGLGILEGGSPILLHQLGVRLQGVTADLARPCTAQLLDACIGPQSISLLLFFVPRCHKAFKVSVPCHKALKVSVPCQKSLKVNLPCHKALKVNLPCHKALKVSLPCHKALKVSLPCHKALKVSLPHHKALKVSLPCHKALKVLSLIHI